MKLREALGDLLEHLDDEVEACIIDVSFEEKVLDDGRNNSKFIGVVDIGFLITHLFRLKQISKQDEEPTDELVKS